MSEQKLEIFNVLNFLNSGYELDDILKEGNFGTFPSADDCIEYLVENGYLEAKGGVFTKESLAKKHTVAQLKELLKKHGLKVSGKKQELVDLIKQFATERKLVCDTKNKIFLKEGKEVGSFKIASKTF